MAGTFMAIPRRDPLPSRPAPPRLQSRPSRSRFSRVNVVETRRPIATRGVFSVGLPRAMGVVYYKVRVNRDRVEGTRRPLARRGGVWVRVSIAGIVHGRIADVTPTTC